jgi:Sec-independent protein translocase protein TatA
MYSFLVLGLVPGTNIQIGFWTWIIIMVVVTVVFRHYKQHLVESLNKWWHQFDEDVENVPREPMHASRLHLRGL